MKHISTANTLSQFIRKDVTARTLVFRPPHARTTRPSLHHHPSARRTEPSQHEPLQPSHQSFSPCPENVGNRLRRRRHHSRTQREILVHGCRPRRARHQFIRQFRRILSHDSHHSGLSISDGRVAHRPYLWRWMPFRAQSRLSRYEQRAWLHFNGTKPSQRTTSRC